MRKEFIKELQKSIYAKHELHDDIANCSNTRWLNKKVYDTKELYDGASMDNLVVTPCIKYMLDTRMYKTGHSSLLLIGDTDVEGVTPRPWPSVHIKLGGVDLTKYNRISVDVYFEATGYENFYCQFALGNKDDMAHHSPSIIPNCWNHINWEISDVKRDNVQEFIMAPWLTGCPDEALPTLSIRLDNVRAERVDEDYQLGWDLDDRVAYSHVGYFPDSRKIALSQKSYSFKVLLDNKVVYSGTPSVASTKLGTYYEYDFSILNKEGSYSLVINDISYPFEIGYDCYHESIWKSLNFLRSLRCGVDVEGVHPACHLNVRCKHPETGATVCVAGGWHDAADLSQFEIPTAEMTHAICDLALSCKDDFMLYDKLKEEAKVGASWLLRTRFGDGYRALAISYSIWRHNVLTTSNNTTCNNVAENGPFENFLSSAALAKTSVLYKEDDDIYSDWCLRAAIEDYHFAVDGYNKGLYTKRWGHPVPSQTLGHAIIAAMELYNITKEESYLNDAVSFSKVVMSCQQVTDPDWDIPLKGFFYEDPEHRWILTYEHRGHENSPIQGIAMLYEAFPNHELASSWKNCLLLYKEYVMKSLELTSPYGLVPGHVYILDKINKERFTIPASYGTIDEGLEILKNQARHGKKLNDGVYLRVMPIAVQRRGFHATLLAKTKAISMIARVLDDKELRQVVIDQLEWVFGKNPFASSTMYGCGHNYHPLYVAFSKQMVGSLPVGIMTKGDDDLPFWPTRTEAVYKEVWGHTTGKYFWVLSDLLRK